jgi:Tol biopolymer transport system component
MKKILIILLAIISLPIVLNAQRFGKNKTQYKNFDWYYIQTEHFDIYFSTGGEYITDFTASVAENALQAMQAEFKYKINNRIPIVVYNSHNDFQQTNVIDEYMEEGVGGVTELFKNRVVIPFEGNYKQFEHVIRHELIHAYINDMFYGGSVQSIISNNVTMSIPLWMNEGLAEYFSLDGWDSNSDMFMRDAAMNEYLPPIRRLGGYFAYRGGQSVWWYIEQKYGREKVADILQKIRSTRNIEHGFKSAIGLSIDELSERWVREQKILYWPDIAKREELSLVAKKMTDHIKDQHFYNSSPTISSNGDKIAFLSDRDDYFDIYVMSSNDPKDVRKLVNGQRTSSLEELHLLTPGITWSPDGEQIALSVKSGAKDAIVIVTVKNRRQEIISFDLEGIFSVNWSPKGDCITFIGNNTRQSDIYVYNLVTKVLTNLTNDIFSDSDPVFSHDGKTIYFSSDRGDYTEPLPKDKNFRIFNHNIRNYDIYSISVETKEITKLTDFVGSDESSVVVSSDNKKILFISDRNGINNIYEKNLETGKIRAITNSLTGIYQLSLSADDSKLVFSSMVYAGFDIFLLKNPFEKKLPNDEIEPTEFRKRMNAQLYKTGQVIAHEITDTINTADTTYTLIIDTTDISKPTITESTTDTIKPYGEKIQIDFQNYVFAESYNRDSLLSIKESSKPIQAVDGRDSLGRYIANKYKLDFSPDIIYGNAGYSTYYGVQGTTQMMFSDILGNHQIYFATNLMLDLKNSDFVLGYYYLPNKIDYGIVGYHSARFLYYDVGFGYYEVHRYRNYGISAVASSPLDKFNRFDFGLGLMNISSENMDNPQEPKQSYTLIVPQVSYTHDHVLWGATAPNNGARYEISLYGSPKLGNNSLGFYTLEGDYRKYFKFWKNYNFVIRTAGGISGGPNPGQFFIGGTENWINYRFENDNIPIESVQDYAFLSPVLPLRGYNYDAKRGSKYVITNFELRFPLIRYFVTGPLPVLFQNIIGTAFIDVGTAWNKSKSLQFFGKDDEGNFETRDMIIGMGFGMRFFFMYFPLKFDIAWPYDFKNFGSSVFYFSIGADF